MTPDGEAFIRVVEDESARCLDVLRDVALDTPVPSCPDWTAEDLAWHLAEVQHFWAAIVGGLMETPEAYKEPDRPDGSAVLDLLARSTSALVAALRAHPPQTRCWSWHDDGHTVGWSARRQAHEALIHRVDAELAAGEPITDPGEQLAVDGVDEMLVHFLSGVPEWGTFTPEEVRVRLETSSTGWTVQLGRFTGTSPSSGRSYDMDAAALIGAGSGETTVHGPAWALDLWLWGRGGPDQLTVSGDDAVVARLRALAAESTQ